MSEMHLTSILTKDYENESRLQLRKKQNQSHPISRSEAETPHQIGPCRDLVRGHLKKQTQFDGLSLLRKQESRVLDDPGFRIKCGMTALKVRLTEYGLYKQTQFTGCPKCT
jgi:hypothetical protein